MTVPGNLSSPLLATAAAAGAAVAGPIKSLRFNGNGNDDPYLERSVSSAGNRRTFTFAAWVKNDVKIYNHDRIFSAGTSSSNIFDITLSATSEGLHLRIYNNTGGSVNTNWNTINKFRDASAWFHVVCAIDTTQATQANRVKVYINGSLITENGTTNTLPGQNADLAVNNATTHYIGRSGVYGDDRFAGYLADVHFIEGSQLTPTSFGAFDDNGVWQAATYNGTYGTRGFHLLDFANESTIGHDSSGNENDFTAVNFTAAAGLLVSGGKSEAVSFDGTDDSLNYSSDTDLNPGTGNFTLECFVYRHAEQISMYYGQNNGDLGIRIQTNGAIGIERRNTAFDLNGVAGDVPDNQWSHVAVTRHAGTLRVYRNGSKIRQASNTQNYTGTFSSGKTPDAFDKGALASLHFVKGTALYTGDSYTVPTTISSHSNTKLLCCQSASSATAATVKPSGVTISTSGSPTAGPFPQTEAKDVDILFDSPVNGTQSDTGAGGEVSGNYAVLNPLDSGSNITFRDGNLEFESETTSGNRIALASIGMTTGKWYFEGVSLDSYSNALAFGIALAGVNREYYLGSDTLGWSWSGEGYAYHNTSGQQNFGSVGGFSQGDVVGVAFDADNGTLKYYKNGSLVGTAYSDLASNTYFFAVSDAGSTPPKAVVNFGQRAFAYAAPSGYKALCTTNLPTPTIAKGSAHFNAKTWTGTGSSHAITGYGFSPDFAWIKTRSNTASHALLDTLRGNSNVLKTEVNNAEVTNNTSVWTSFDSDGFTLGADNNNGWTNWNGWTYVGWGWNAGANSNKTYTVKVVSDSGNKYRFDDHGTSAVTLDLAEGSTYIFDQSDSSNAGHPLRFSTTSDGTHGSGSEYTTGVTATGTPGQAGAKTTIVLGTGVATLYYYCTAHSGMGGQINTNSTAGSTRLSNSLTSTLYRQDEVYSTRFSPTPSVGGTKERAFNGYIGSQGGYMNGGGTWTPSSAITYYDKVEVYDGVDQKYGINGGTESAIPLNQWYTLASTTDPNGATLSSISMTRISDASTTHTFAGLKIDGKLLVDSNVDITTPSINSIVKANPEAGISVVTFTYPSSGKFKCAHGLNDAPGLIITKHRNRSSDWYVWHSAFSNEDQYININSNGAKASATDFWGEGAPDSATFGGNIGTSGVSGDTDVALVFAPVAGFSAFGTYEGTGSSSTAPFVYTGMRPRWIMFKNIDTGDSSTDWVIYDTARTPSNGVDDALFPNRSVNEANETSHTFDILSNGFKVRSTSTSGLSNKSGDTYLYAAFAENPFSLNGGLAR